MVLENDYMIYNIAFSLPITIKRISTANTFPYGSCVKESYRQETNFIRKSYFYTGVVFVCFFFFREGVCGTHHGFWDLSPPNRDRTWALNSGSAES